MDFRLFYFHVTKGNFFKNQKQIPQLKSHLQFVTIFFNKVYNVDV